MSRIRSSTDKTVANSLSRELSTMPAFHRSTPRGLRCARPNDSGTRPPCRSAGQKALQDANVIANGRVKTQVLKHKRPRRNRA